MSIFNTNLNNFQRALGLSRDDVIEMSGLSHSQIRELEAGSSQQSLLFTFCFNLDLELASIFSEKGFANKSVQAQYASYPVSFRKVVTEKMCKKLKKRCHGDKALLAKLNCAIPGRKTQVSRFLMGNSAFEEDQISLVTEAFSDCISPTEFSKLLAETMWTLVPNWNYNTLRNYFGVTYPVIAGELMRSTSNVSNWGGTYCIPIPEHVIKDISEALGGFNELEFKTRLISSVECEGRTSKWSSSNRLPDEILDNISDKGEKNIKKKRRKNILPSDKTESNTHLELSDSQFAVTIHNDKVIKMFLQLNQASRRKATSVITELFLEQL